MLVQKWGVRESEMSRFLTQATGEVGSLGGTNEFRFRHDVFMFLLDIFVWRYLVRGWLLWVSEGHQ